MSYLQHVRKGHKAFGQNVFAITIFENTDKTCMALNEVWKSNSNEKGEKKNP